MSRGFFALEGSQRTSPTGSRTTTNSTAPGRPLRADLPKLPARVWHG